MVELLLPNLLIAGVHKAATTSLFAYLTKHPSICGSTKKEIHYYTPLRYGGKTASLSSYSDHFRACQKHIWRLEASPSYLYLPKDSIELIRTELKAPKIIFILREPEARFISYYKHCVSKYLIDEKTSFEEFCIKSFHELDNPMIDSPTSRSLREGNYSQFLEPWLNWGPEHVHLVFFESFISDPKSTMTAICSWLHIDPTLYDTLTFDVENKTVGSKNKTMFRLAQRMNAGLESFWRKNPTIKKQFRSIYYLLNGKKMTTEIDTTNKKTIENYYYQEKIRLKNLLLKHEVKNLPEWLNRV